MFYVVYVMLGGLVVGSLMIGSNPSPLFGVVSLVLLALVACGVLVVSGYSFLSLVLFLVYLGGMTVVFAYSVSMSSELQPEAWFGWSVLPFFLGGSLGVVFVVVMILGGDLGYLYFGFYSNDCVGLSVVRSDVLGVSLLYWSGLVGLLLLGYVLMLTLFVVLELVRGLASGCVRSVY
uniref:NADH dehydrogenase subunit 6 n=1 Tax=Varanus rudicollis TaxID=169851 RepID=UPI00218218DB|nr:NADH dehydrogenase subunit 6 [Varanus rudicollis]BDP99530.1 NADH dehydrogenase subunit 6 [Varanus rudicollis]